MGSQELFDCLLELIGTPTIDSGKITAALDLKEKHFPARLYKYRTVSNYALDNLKNSTLHLAPATKLNDPYDSAVLMDPLEGRDYVALLLQHFQIAEEIKEKILAADDPMDKFIHAIAAESITPFSEDFIARFKIFLQAQHKKSINQLKERFSRYVQESVKICSLSERLDSLPLWAHYSQNHEGFVMEYDFQSPTENFIRNLLWPVSYSGVFDARPILNGRLGKPGMNNLIPVLAALYKAPDWQYEKEWRVVLQDSPSPSGINMTAPLKAVYLGSKIKPDQAQQVIEAAAVAKVPVLKMQLVPHEFRMEVTSLD